MAKSWNDVQAARLKTLADELGDAIEENLIPATQRTSAIRAYAACVSAHVALAAPAAS